MRTAAGFFMPEKSKTFKKPPFTTNQLLEKLIDCGLHVSDNNQALHYLQHINYFRLRGYGLPFEKHSRNIGKPKEFIVGIKLIVSFGVTGLLF